MNDEMGAGGADEGRDKLSQPGVGGKVGNRGHAGFAVLEQGDDYDYGYDKDQDRDYGGEIGRALDAILTGPGLAAVPRSRL